MTVQSSQFVIFIRKKDFFIITAAAAVQIVMGNLFPSLDIIIIGVVIAGCAISIRMGGAKPWRMRAAPLICFRLGSFQR